MSELSYLEKLLDGAEVEWVALNKLATFLKGKSLPKEKITPDGNRYCIHYGELFTHYGPIIDKVCSKTNQAINESILSEKNDVLMPTSDVTPRGLATASCIQESGVILGGDILIIRCSGVDGRYLSNFIINNKKKILQMVKGSTVYHLYAKDIGKLLIPIPCPNNPEKSLAIQSEIVRILDKFTALTAELTAELNMRKKQYNYYRDQLLSFKDGEVEWKTLGEIGEFIRGKRFTKADYVEDGGISVIHYGEIYTRYGVYTTHSLSQVRADMAASLRYAKHGDVVITDVGETVEDVGKAVAWLGDDDIAIHDHCYAFRHSLNPKFISYYMQTDSFISEKAKYVARTKVNTLLINGFSKIMIPVPYPKDHEKSLKEQARIVEILDKFDTLTNSITEGLPREIELRQKQYEYYRDLLFSFPKPETVSN
ncbi:restriction endonuclease subunit S [Escherichia coli]|uniref:restriction endonuclease subunit S n=2 Tax=Escherichia coli TaxID=562 RepID=UPI001F13F659|nr:restriction endonuclease subunit S [Escherichia coli]MCH6241202.1 restriction endonuclease subunit S [Escherichia coli]